MYDLKTFGKTVKLQLNSMSRDKHSGDLEAMGRGRFGNAYSAFKIASSLVNSWREKISDIYFNAGNKSEKPCFNFYRRAKEFSDKHNKEIGQLLAALAKTKGISEKRQKDIKAEAARYLSEEEMLKAFPPDYIQYKHGEETPIFELAAGQTTEKWIRAPVESNCGFYSNNGKYEVCYRNGCIWEKWAGDKPPKKANEDFKIRAKEATRVKVIFEKLQ